MPKAEEGREGTDDAADDEGPPAAMGASVGLLAEGGLGEPFACLFPQRRLYKYARRPIRRYLRLLKRQGKTDNCRRGCAIFDDYLRPARSYR